jgi:hypothetical protein
MQEWQIKVKNEQTDLEVKIKNLQNFIYGDTWELLDPLNQGLLRAQCTCMMAYNDILNQRISLFK